MIKNTICKIFKHKDRQIYNVFGKPVYIQCKRCNTVRYDFEYKIKLSPEQLKILINDAKFQLMVFKKVLKDIRTSK